MRASQPRSAAPAASAASSSHRARRVSSAVGAVFVGRRTWGSPVIHQALPFMGSIKIARLLEDRDYGLQLTLVTGAEGLGRVITSSRIQKPGLALAGFTEHLHPERVQVFGNTEISYLNTLDEATQREALKKLSDSDLACVVVTKDLPHPPLARGRLQLRAARADEDPAALAPPSSSRSPASSTRRSPSPPACTAC